MDRSRRGGRGRGRGAAAAAAGGGDSVALVAAFLALNIAPTPALNIPAPRPQGAPAVAVGPIPGRPLASVRHPRPAVGPIRPPKNLNVNGRQAPGPNRPPQPRPGQRSEPRSEGARPEQRANGPRHGTEPRSHGSDPPPPGPSHRQGPQRQGGGNTRPEVRVQLRVWCSTSGVSLVTRSLVKSFMQVALACARDDVAAALALLGDSGTAGLTRLAEICGLRLGGSSWESLHPALALLQFLANPAMVGIGRLHGMYWSPIIATLNASLPFNDLVGRFAELVGRTTAAQAQLPITDDIMAVQHASLGAYVSVSAMSITTVLDQIKATMAGEAQPGLGAAIDGMQAVFRPTVAPGVAPGQVQWALTPSAAATLTRLGRLVSLERDIAAGIAAGVAARERRAIERLAASRAGHGAGRNAAMAGDELPGELRPSGPRHDNDFARIQDIQVSPTPAEIGCEIAPYLPRNEPGGSPHLDSGSPEAHLDTHFRLLRHDLLASLTESMTSFLRAGGLRALRGNVYAARTGGRNDVELSVYRRASLVRGIAHRKAGLAYEVHIDELPGNRGSLSRRRAFWDETQRLSNGTLIALYAEPAGADPLVVFFVGAGIERNGPPLSASPRPDMRVTLNLSACDAEDHPRILRLMETAAAGAEGAEALGEMVLIQASGSFFAYEPVLKALQACVLPAWFHPYCGAVGVPADASLPAYLTPATRYDITCLMRTTGPPPPAEDVARVRNMSVAGGPLPLMSMSRVTGLDDMQTRALAAALTRDLVLIQGPPGTGKTYVGALIVAALLANTQVQPPDAAARRPVGIAPPEPRASAKPVIGPIIVLCLTNHALDQFLETLLKKGVRNLIRVGGRSKCEALADYNLKAVSKSRGNLRSATSSLIAATYERLRGLQADMASVLESLLVADLSLTWPALAPIAGAVSPGLAASLEARQGHEAVADAEGFITVRLRNFFGDWKGGKDLVRPPPPPPPRPAAPQRPANRYGVLTRARAIALSLLGGDDEAGDDEPQAAPVVAPVVDDDGRLCEGFGPRTPENALDSETVERLLVGGDVFALGRRARSLVLTKWAELRRESLRSEAELLAASIAREQATLEGLHNAKDLEVLRHAAVVGFTTSGGSRLQALLRSLGARVVLVEEAGEVLESHVCACIGEATQQLILIGDHKQLRPSVEQYGLSIDSGKGYNLDISMFERLILVQEVPVITLRTQWRMRPEISALIKQTVYPELEDAVAVRNLPNVAGMRSNLFFLTHAVPESGAAQIESKSKSNAHEAALSVKLAKYLLQQGVYGPEDITILVPYVGQLMRVRQLLAVEAIGTVFNDRDETEVQARMDSAAANSPEEETEPEDERPLLAAGWKGAAEIRRPMTECLRAATVDNFQGEESKVVIVDLVRSNPNGNIGFMKLINRVNVMLSRAQHGMYIIGNPECFRAGTARSGGLWDKLIHLFEEQGGAGPALHLVCANHPKTVTAVSSADQFAALAGEGGCTRLCEARLPSCGHQCPKRCHVSDKEHAAVFCPQPCNRLFEPCGHTCCKPCGEPCRRCEQPIANVGLPCGHTLARVPCFQAVTPGTIPCGVSVVVKPSNPVCGHEVTVLCGQAATTRDGRFACRAPCSEPLACGHACSGACGTCAQEGAQKIHQACRVVCGRPQVCGHACRQACHGAAPCPPCTDRCMATNCPHSICKQGCQEPCLPCAQSCAWGGCPHREACALVCGAPCERLPCDARCVKQCACGHRCPSLCGETCPPACIACSPASITDQVVDMVNLTTAREATPDDDPLLYLACGHVYTITTLDGWLGLESVYARDASGAWASLLPFGSAMVENRGCPQCRRPVAGIRRYGRVINKMALDTAERKFALRTQRTLRDGPGARALRDAEALVAALPAVPPSDDGTLPARAAIRRARDALESDAAVVARPPSKSVYEASVAALSRAVEAAGPSPRFAHYGGIDLASIVAAGGALSQLPAVRGLLLPFRPDCRPGVEMAIARARVDLLGATVIWAAARGGMARLDAGVGDALRRAMDAASAFHDSASRRLQSGLESAEADIARRSIVAVRLHMARASLLRSQHTGLTAQPALVRAIASGAEQAAAARAAQAAFLDAADAHLARASDVATAGMIVSSPSEPLPAGIAAVRAEVAAERRALAGPTYEPLTVEEKAAIYAAMNAGTSGHGIFDMQGPGYTGQGHWYTCPNGHVFVIGDCGGAVVQARCAECGAAIGGGGERLRADNGVAEDFVRDARRGGPR